MQRDRRRNREGGGTRELRGGNEGGEGGGGGKGEDSAHASMSRQVMRKFSRQYSMMKTAKMTVSVTKLKASWRSGCRRGRDFSIGKKALPRAPADIA